METVLLHATIIAYLLSLAACAVMLIGRRPAWNAISRRALYASLLSHTALLAVRTVSAQRLPLTNLYETLLVFSWGIAAVSAYIIGKHGFTAIGAATLPMAAAALCCAARMDSAVHPLPPALHSGWLFVHVSLAVISYGAFAVAGGLGVLYLILDRLRLKDTAYPSGLPQPQTVDALIFSTISLGFPCLVLVILTGSIWAQQAWGSYWSWDPKETWALLTAVIYTLYLHTRLRLGWNGTRSAWMAILGFAAVLFCYLGVTLLLGGLHSYAVPGR